MQNNTAINIATSVKWIAINEECLIWTVVYAGFFNGGGSAGTSHRDDVKVLHYNYSS